MPDRFGRAALKGVDAARPALAVAALTVAVPVIHVEQPVHGVDVARAVGGLQFGVEWVRTDRDAEIKRRGVASLRWEFCGVACRLPGEVAAVGRLVLGRRDDVLFKRLHGFLQSRPVAGLPAVGGLEPDPVTEGFRGGHVAVIGRFDDQRFDGVIRDAFGAEVAVLLVVQILPQCEESLGIDAAGLLRTGLLGRLCADHRLGLSKSLHQQHTAAGADADGQDNRHDSLDLGEHHFVQSSLYENSHEWRSRSRGPR